MVRRFLEVIEELELRDLPLKGVLSCGVVGTMGLGPTTPANRPRPTKDHRMMAKSFLFTSQVQSYLPNRVGHMLPRHCLSWPVNIFKRASE